MSINHEPLVSGTNNPAYPVSKDAWNAAQLTAALNLSDSGSAFEQLFGGLTRAAIHVNASSVRLKIREQTFTINIDNTSKEPFKITVKDN